MRPQIAERVPSDAAWLSAWQFEPFVAAVLLASFAAYLLGCRASARAGRPTPPAWQIAAFVGGIASLAVALMGPPDLFADTAFSAHMFQHVMLTLLAAPLIVLGRPLQVALRSLRPSHARAVVGPTLGHPAPRGLLGLLTYPLVVVLLFNGAMLLWHLPLLYEAAVRNRPIHNLEHASFLGAALLFWWVLIDPVPRRFRVSTSAALLMLFTTWMIGDLLGATLTLANRLLYPVYVDTPKPWQLTALADQRIGGLIMWIGGGVLFAALMIARLAAPYVRREARLKNSERTVRVG